MEVGNEGSIAVWVFLETYSEMEISVQEIMEPSWD